MTPYKQPGIPLTSLNLYIVYYHHITNMSSKPEDQTEGGRSKPRPMQNKSLPINDTPLNRYFTLCAIKLLGSFRPRHSSVLMLTDKLCVKYGTHVHLSEASTMRFISEHTSIPVPRILSAFVRGGRTYILMERIKGGMIGFKWVHRSEESKAKLLSQLRGFIQQMREIPVPEGTKIGSVDGGSILDDRLSAEAECIGPHDNVGDFHLHLRAGIEPGPQYGDEIQELFREHDRFSTVPLKFTHGDLSSFNILARGDDIVGIVDWERSGWFPSYWEYSTASYVAPMNAFWANEIDKFLDPMPEELAMERLRQKYFGEF